jgi:hypothetical protein
MSLSTDLKYFLLLTPRFEKYQRKSDYLFNVRCPICGDSQKNKSKMRGYVYRVKNDLRYKCHNCGAGMSIGNLIKHLDSNIHREYTMERYKSGEIGTNDSRYNKKELFDIPAPRFGKLETPTYQNAERCDLLSSQHFCRTYLEKRKVPKEFYSKLYFTANFEKFCNEVYPNHDKEIVPDARLVIPFFDEWNSLAGVSGRALATADTKLRYVTLKTNDSPNKLIYGLDRIDFNKPVKIVEGPIDSLFLNNCLASGDSSLHVTAKYFEAKEKILIFDNEPRNKEIVKLMQDAIRLGHDIVIWPNMIQGKDINEMVMSGVSPDEIEGIISNNTFRGLEAQAKFVFWKKV